jgi:hypothetical protein
VQIVQLAAHAEEEIQRLEALRQLHGGQQAQRRQRLEVVQAMPGARDPKGRVEIPQPSRSLLDIGLLQVDGAPILAVPLELLPQLELDVLLRPPSLEGPPHPLLEAGEDVRAPGQEARLQHRGAGREVGVHHPHGVVQRAAAVAHAEAQVPQEVQDVIQDRGHVPVHAPGVQEHHVHVGARVQLPSPVAAQRHQGTALAPLPECRRHDPVGQPEELTHHRIDQVRVAGHDLKSAGPASVRRLDAGPFLGDELLHRGQQCRAQRLPITRRGRGSQRLQECLEAERHLRLGPVGNGPG